MSGDLRSEGRDGSANRRAGGSFALGLLSLAAITAYFRFRAIGWGAPFVYHPDEHFVLQPALDIVRTGSLNPHWFQYPSLLIYAEALLVFFLRPFTGASLESNHLVSGIGPWDALPEQWPFVYAGRWLVALCGVAGVLLLALAARRLRGNATALLAGAFLMMSALHNQSGHYLTTDVPAAMLVAACMAATAAPRPLWILTGVLAGLAAGTKYTAGAVLLAPLLTALDSGSSPRRTPAAWLSEVGDRWLRIGLGLVFGFVVSTPYAVLDLPEFLDGLEAQRRNYHAWAGQTGNLSWYVRYLFTDGLGFALAAIAAGGIVCGIAEALLALRRGEPIGRRLGFLLPPLLYIPWLASFPSRAERNLIVVLPFLCLAAAIALDAVGRFLRPRWLATSVLLVAAGIAFASAFPRLELFEQRLMLPDNRTLALEWMRENLPKGTKIAREEYTPQLQKGEFDVSYVFSLARRPYADYLGERVEYLVASSNIYGRAVEPPYIAGESGREFYRVLFTLPLVKEWPQGPYSNGPTIRLYKIPLSPAGNRS